MDTIETAARVLAFGLGYGGAWITEHGTTDYGKPDGWVPGAYGNERTPAATATLHIARETETLELAKRAIHWKPQKQPDWFKRLPKAEQKRLQAWCGDNPLTGGGAHRVREFEHWQTATTYALVPRSPDGSAVAAALAMAKLPGPLRPVLELAALERLEHVPTVLLYLRACGTRDDVAREALSRWFWPHAHGHTLEQAAKAAHMRKGAYGRLVRDARARLHRWQREASKAFLQAYGNRKPRKDGVMVRAGETCEPRLTRLQRIETSTVPDDSAARRVA